MKDIVRKGYDQISYAYRGDDDDAACQQYHTWLDELAPLIPAGSAVLDLSFRERRSCADLGS